MQEARVAFEQSSCARGNQSRPSSAPSYPHWFTDVARLLNKHRVPHLNTTFEENTMRHDVLMQRIATFLNRQPEHTQHYV